MESRTALQYALIGGKLKLSSKGHLSFLVNGDVAVLIDTRLWAAAGFQLFKVGHNIGLSGKAKGSGIYFYINNG